MRLGSAILLATVLVFSACPKKSGSDAGTAGGTGGGTGLWMTTTLSAR